MSHQCSHGHHHLPLTDTLLTGKEQQRLFKQLALALITMGLLVLSLIWQYLAPEQAAASNILAGIASLMVAIPVIRSAWFSLRYPDLHGVTDLLIALAMMGAWALGDLMTAATLPIIMIFGHILEERGVMGTRQAIEALSKLTHSRARRIDTDGRIEETDNQQLRPGDVVEIRTGDNVPADGVILSGYASLDVASITGESVPMEVSVGDPAYGGAINLNGLLRMRVTLTGENATLGKVIALMKDAEQAKPPVTRLLERYAGHYLILVLMIVAVTWFLTYDSQAMLAVLVAACPCALVLSAPATSMAGITVAARNGILIRNTAFLEELADVDAMIVDKTGTLTQGQLHLDQIIAANQHSDNDILSLASSLGASSSHPVSRALAQYATAASSWELRNVHEIHGIGISAMTTQGRALLGRAALFERYGVQMTNLPEYEGPVVGVGLNGVFFGWLLLTDAIRPEAAEAVQQLKLLGIEKHLLLTGDRSGAARKIAEQTGILDFEAEALPADKLRWVQQSVADGWHPMVVGDGINDALALKAGAVGVAMGKSGADIAMASADIVLTSSDLRRLPFAIRLSRACRKTLQTNVIIGLGWTLMIIGMAALGIFGSAGALIAALLHNLSTFLVLANTGRLLNFDYVKPPAMVYTASDAE